MSTSTPTAPEIPWTEVGTINLHAGTSVGGDYQASEAAGRRFQKELPDGTFLTLDVYAYVSDEYHQKGMAREEKVWEVQEMTMLSHHTDPDDPGSSELDADVEYRYPFDTAGLTKRRTLVQARDHIRSLSPERI